MTHYPQCGYWFGAPCVCQEIKETPSMGLYTEQDLDAERIKGRREGLLLSLPVLLLALILLLFILR